MSGKGKLRDTAPVASGLGDVLAWAKLYRALGWRIIPAGHGLDRKRPPRGFKWAKYRKQELTDAELARWFGKGGKSYPAVILGEPSGGLACRDFDEADEYFAWTVDHPELAKSMATVETGRGFHVYFILADGECFRDYGDGELRGDASTTASCRLRFTRAPKSTSGLSSPMNAR